MPEFNVKKKTSDPQGGIRARVVIKRSRRVRRRTRVQFRDVIAAVLSIMLGLAAIGIVPMILFTRLDNDFGWLAALFAYLSFCGLDTIGTDPQEDLDS